MSFYDDFLRTAPMFNSNSRVSSLDYLEPTTRSAVLLIMQEAGRQGTPLLCFETYRSRQRQQELFRQGATQLQEVGVHHYGLAVDLVKDINGEPSWKGDFSFLGKLAQTYGMISGLDWGQPGVHHGFVDACHIQRVAVPDQLRLFSGLWYPDGDYDPYATTSGRSTVV